MLQARMDLLGQSNLHPKQVVRPPPLSKPERQDSVDDFLAQELVVQESIQEFMMDQDATPPHATTDPPTLVTTGAFKRFERPGMERSLEKYRMQDQCRRYTLPFPSFPDMNCTGSHTLSCYAHSLASDYRSGPSESIQDLNLFNSQNTSAHPRPAPDEVPLIRTSRLMKQGSVDDFLADERARRLSVSDFLFATDMPPAAVGAPALAAPAFHWPPAPACAC